MNVYPLENMTLEQAMQKQFKLVDCITHHFRGAESLTRGDLACISRQPAGNDAKSGTDNCGILRCGGLHLSSRQRYRRNPLWLKRDDRMWSEDSDSQGSGIFNDADQF